MQKKFAGSLAALLLAGQAATPWTAMAATNAASGYTTATPIKHLVVIFQENISFDHYFGTYPNAVNPSGEPYFYQLPGIGSVNGFSDGLLYNNPNYLNTADNGAGASNPFRLDRTEAATADQDHSYTPEQEAFHAGLMDRFPEYTGAGNTSGAHETTGLVMGYFDGNTVTAYWNYAQVFALNDNSHGTTFGASTQGAINLISGQTGGVGIQQSAGSDIVADGQGGYTLTNDANPYGDVCSSGAEVQLTGQNIGDLLNARGITWGFFEGGFNLGATNTNGTTGCARSTTSAVTGVTEVDYIEHHQPFQYYASTANPKHLRPTSAAMIGVDGDQANHQYDITDFATVLENHNMPAVSFLKAPGYEDGHAGYSDPLDEQNFVVTVVNAIQATGNGNDTAVIIAYDDSDGWYDHQMGPIMNQSATAQDALTGTNACGSGVAALDGPSAAHVQGRCGYGPRLPLLVLSPYAKAGFVDHTLTDQTSITRFIEDNWLGSQRITGSFDSLAGSLMNMFDFKSAPRTGSLILNPSTGDPY